MTGLYAGNFVFRQHDGYQAFFFEVFAFFVKIKIVVVKSEFLTLMWEIDSVIRINTQLKFFMNIEWYAWIFYIYQSVLAMENIEFRRYFRLTVCK